MKKKPKKVGVFKYFDRDEQLLFSSRAGNYSAGNELLNRLFNLRFAIGRSVSPTLVRLLDSWEFNHAFFDAYNKTCKNYKHFSGATIRTYFSRVMKNSIIAEASTNQVYQRVRTLSFDDERYSSEGAEYTLCDIVPADEDVYSDVTYYMNYMESVERYLNKDFKLDSIDKAIVRLRADGLTYEEISKTLSIPYTRARESYIKFYNAVLKTIKTDSIGTIKKNLDKLL